MIYVFFITTALLMYTFAGYPMLVGWLARRVPKAPAPVSSGNHSVTVLLVACNEAAVINTKLRNLLALKYQPEKLRIVIVDDASDDGTVEAVLAVKDNRITLLCAEVRSGKAAGLNLAMASVQSELVMMVDARQEIESDALLHLAAWFEASQTVGAMSGELKFRSEGQNDFAKGMDGYWRYEKYIRKAESGYASVPGVTGAIYLLRTKAFQPIAPDTILDDVLIPMQCIAQGYSVGFDDRAIAWDNPSSDQAKEKRRKTRTICGNYQLLFRFPAWLLPGGHPIWWQYVSHKVLRLAAPLFAVAGLIACVFMAIEGSILAGLYAAGFLFVLMIVPASAVVPAILNNRLLRLLVAFVVLNWFSVLGFWEYLFGKKSQSWKK